VRLKERSAVAVSRMLARMRSEERLAGAVSLSVVAPGGVLESEPSVARDNPL
jgi:hypothetical protein